MNVPPLRFWLLAVGMAYVGWGMFQPIRCGGGPTAFRFSCQSNLKQIGRGYQQYIQDYDEKLPPVSARGKGWVTILQPYVKSIQIYRCPSFYTPHPTHPSSDYFFNTRLASSSMERLKSAEHTVINGDGAGAASLDVHLSQLPPAWVHDDNSPARRHMGGANYAFADGHVKWLFPRRITSGPVKSGRFTFAVR